MYISECGKRKKSLEIKRKKTNVFEYTRIKECIRIQV